MDVDARVHIYTATALGRGRVASPTLDRLYLKESPRYSIYRRLSGSQDQPGLERIGLYLRGAMGEISNFYNFSPRFFILVHVFLL